SAHLGAGREYDLWVFSDHGQETTLPYENQNDKSIQSIIANWVDKGIEVPADPSKHLHQRLPTRANWLGINWLVSMAFGEQDHDIQTRSPNVQTVTSGSLGFVYLLNPQALESRDELAEKLVSEFQVPMTAQPLPQQRVKIHSPEGTYFLPDDAVQVFGADHPFLEDVTQDFVRLVHHEDAGDVTLVGWNSDKPSTSFVLQHGAHAGPGSQETNGFALLPNDIPLPETEKRYLRPDDLRRTALHFLDRTPQGTPLRRVKVAEEESIRIMTYNVHACVGMDGQLSPQRIARVIAQSAADVICLQELDVGRKRSGNLDQPHVIAEYLKMNHHFHPAWHVQEERFGNAILTRFPMQVVRTDGLHQYNEDRSRRSALWVEIDIGKEKPLQLINTHLSIYPQEQLLQAQQLVKEWVEPARLAGPIVVCGDFNARPNSKTHKAFASALGDVDAFNDGPSRSTYFSPFPVLRVDHIFVNEMLKPINVEVPFSRMARIASDHLPLTTDLKVSSLTRQS
ncbi:MAG: endonuclease/exonuclease/phosphatase family protein, partial [Pirellulaceae bacterium]|nr:endonuclease/exonuclease/phosphatase family protein [Pirellulaceae bacterium]